MAPDAVPDSPNEGESSVASVAYRCDASRFRPHTVHDVRWLDYEADHDLLLDWNPRFDFTAKDEGFTYAAITGAQRIVSIAAKWTYSSEPGDSCELAAVRTVSDRRNEGLSTSVCSFVTADIIASDRSATCHTRKANLPMRAVAESLGYELIEEYLERFN